MSDLRCPRLTSFRFRSIISERFSYSKIVHGDFPTLGLTTSACFVCNARHTSSRSVQGRAGGAGNSRFLGIGERAGSIGTRICAELLAILRVCIVRNLSAQYLPRIQQPRDAPDDDQRKNPEISTGRRTSPSADACPTPHCGMTQRRSARQVPANATSTRVSVAGRESAQRTPPTRGQAPPPRTHAAT